MDFTKKRLWYAQIPIGIVDYFVFKISSGTSLLGRNVPSSRIAALYVIQSNFSQFFNNYLPLGLKWNLLLDFFNNSETAFRKTIFACTITILVRRKRMDFPRAWNLSMLPKVFLKHPSMIKCCENWTLTRSSGGSERIIDNQLSCGEADNDIRPKQA